MNEGEDNSVRVTLQADRIKGAFSLMPMPVDYLQKIASILLTWGRMEAAFDDFLAGMIKANGSCIEEKWKGRNFRKRRDFFKEEMKTTFQRSAQTRDFLRDWLARASTLQIDRNLLAHGCISLDIKPEMVWVIAIGMHNGKKIRKDYNRENLEDVYYGIGHLCGDISLSPGFGPRAGITRLRERRILREFVDQHLASPAIAPTHESLQEWRLNQQFPKGRSRNDP